MQFIKEIKSKIMFFALIGIIYLLTFTKQDLPVHCLKHEVFIFINIKKNFEKIFSK